MILKSHKTLIQAGFILVCSLSLTSCFDGDGSINIGQIVPGAQSGVSIAIDKIQNVSRGSWVVDSGGKVYVTSSVVRVDGHCTRGVGSVTVAVDGVVAAETAVCGVDGGFVWNKVFSSVTPALGTQYVLEVRGMKSDGSAIAGVTATETIVIDTNAPTAPVLNAVAGCSLSLGVWICNSAHVQISGSWSAVEDVSSLQFPNGGTVAYPTATTFTYDFDLTEGQTRSLDFTVKDRAGNTSGTSLLSVSYSPTTSALASSVNAGGTVGFAGGPVNTAASMIGNVGSVSGRSLDLNSALPANQRVQLQIGPIAVGAQQLNP